MEKIAERIRDRRQELDMSQDELAEKVGYKSRSSINKIEKDARNLPQTKIVLIADALNVSPAYLMGWEENPKQKKFIPLDMVTEDIMIPILGTIPCGQAYEAIEDIIDYIAINQFMYDKGVRYALIADGESMYPEIKNKDIMLIKPTPQVDSGAVAIVKVNGDDATCKKIQIGESTLTLIPYNNNFETQVFTADDVIDKPVTIIGQVVETRRKFI